MPQLNKANLVLMFFCTWTTLYLISKLIKKADLSSNCPNNLETHKPTPWYWPYT